MGFAFDGDGDRLGLIDNKGNVIWADRQMILYARDILSRNQGAKIVFDVKCSSNLPKDITQHGGNAIMSRTGHSFIKAKLKETGALLGGEMSGHIFFKEHCLYCQLNPVCLHHHQRQNPYPHWYL
jgi:phosphomannomutase/phosphoglucomutase